MYVSVFCFYFPKVFMLFCKNPVIPFPRLIPLCPQSQDLAGRFGALALVLHQEEVSPTLLLAPLMDVHMQLIGDP